MDKLRYIKQKCKSNLFWQCHNEVPVKKTHGTFGQWPKYFSHRSARNICNLLSVTTKWCLLLLFSRAEWKSSVRVKHHFSFLNTTLFLLAPCLAQRPTENYIFNSKQLHKTLVVLITNILLLRSGIWNNTTEGCLH